MKRRLTSVVAQLILVLGGTLGVLLVLSDVAAAAPDYPSNYCTFSQASKTTISAECRDDQANGGFDGKNFTSKPASPTRYTLTEKTQGTEKVVGRGHTTWTGKALSCTATITARDTGEATITGSYLKIKVVVNAGGDGTKTEYECAALLEGPVGLRRDEARLDAWVKAYISATTDDLTSECAGNPDTVTACKSAVPSAVSKCMDKGSDAYAALDNFLLLTDERKKDVYIDKASACLSDALKGVTGFSLSPADVIRIVQGNKAKADEAAGKIADSPAPPSPEPEGGEDATEPVCSAGALGWVICPAMSAMIDATTWMADTLQGYLTFNPFSGDGGAVIKGVWSNILAVANVLLVIAFFIVIFSQATSIGLSSYGVKKMLPKIVVAAVLMNLSYYFCQILIDISNIAGVGVASLVSSASGNTFSDNVAEISGFSKILVSAGVVAIVAFFFLVPVLASFLAVFLTIAARNAIIVLLVIVSPLAFIAWVLPNTEKWFKKWWELLVNLLLLFPLTMLLFASSIVAANTVSSATPPDATGGAELQGIIALLILAMPLFAMPFLFKIAGGALGKINDMANRRLNQGIDPMAKWTGKKAKQYGKFGAFAAGGALSRAGNKLSGGKMFNPDKPGRITRAYRGIRAFDKATELSLEARKQGKQAEITENAAKMGQTGVGSVVIGGVGGSRYSEIIAQQMADASEKRIKANIVRYERGGKQGAEFHFKGDDGATANGYLIDQFHDAIKRNDHEQAQAVVTRLTNLGVGGRKALERLVSETEVQDGSMRDAITKSLVQDNYSSLVSSRGDIAKGGYDSNTHTWNTAGSLGKVGTEQLSKQDVETLEKHYDDIDALEAQRIISEPELKANVTNARALEILHARAEGLPKPAAGVSTSLPGTTTRPTLFTSEQAGSMSPAQVQVIVDAQGGVQKLTDSDLKHIADSHGTEAVGITAKNELRIRQRPSSSTNGTP